MAQAKMAQQYRIGTVSKITGIAPETLRIWERRYDIVSPLRGSSGTRLYSDEDVRYLGLLKQLVERGHAIGSLAQMTVAELEERLQTHASMQKSAQSSSLQLATISVCVLGQGLPGMLQGYENNKSNVHFNGMYTSVADFEAHVQDVKPEVLVLEYPSLQMDHIKEIRERFRYSNARRLIVVYGFSNRSVLNKLKNENTVLRRNPVDYFELVSLCNAPLVSAVKDSDTSTGKSTSRRFSDAQLSKISAIQTDVGCECPHHVADILNKLVAFEIYSQDCEDKNSEDAVLHAKLHRITMNARSTFESALEQILIADGIEIDRI